MYIVIQHLPLTNKMYTIHLNDLPCASFMHFTFSIALFSKAGYTFRKCKDKVSTRIVLEYNNHICTQNRKSGTAYHYYHYSSTPSTNIISQMLSFSMLLSSTDLFIVAFGESIGKSSLHLVWGKTLITLHVCIMERRMMNNLAQCIR